MPEDKLKNIKQKLSNQEKKFVEEYREEGNGTQAVKDAFGETDDNRAGVKAHALLRNPKIQVYLDEDVEMAISNIKKLANNAKNENVRLGANKDIIDRNRGKSPQGIDITTDGEKLEAGVVILPVLNNDNGNKQNIAG